MRRGKLLQYVDRHAYTLMKISLDTPTNTTDTRRILIHISRGNSNNTLFYSSLIIWHSSYNMSYTVSNGGFL